MSSSSPLLRVSDFCRPNSFASSSSSSVSHPSPSPSSPTVLPTPARRQQQQQRPCLWVIPQMTTITMTVPQSSPSQSSPPSRTCCAVGWVDAEVLIALSQKEGEYARLSVMMEDATTTSTTSANHSHRRRRRRNGSIMLRLYLNPHESSARERSGEGPGKEHDCGDEGEETPRAADPTADNTDSVSSRSRTRGTRRTTRTTTRVIRLPPITWMNLMGRRPPPRESMGDDDDMDSVMCLVETMIDTCPLPAATVLLRPLARPPEWPRLPLTVPTDTNNNATHTSSSSSSPSSSTQTQDHPTFVWKYPAPHTLIEPSKLLSVYEKNPNPGRRRHGRQPQDDDRTSSLSSCCYYYQVMDVTVVTKEEEKLSTMNHPDGNSNSDSNDNDNNDNNDNDDNDDPHDQFYIITNSTVFQLDHRPLFSNMDDNNNNDPNTPPTITSIPRLPCFLAQKHYYDSQAALLLSSSSQDHPPPPLPHHHHSKEFKVPPHPDLPTLSAALDLVGVTSPAHERIIHVVGTDQDHDLSWAVETASHHVGRTCWSLQGLAATAHALGHKIRTGSLLDQLAGLQAALKEIQQLRMEPCVLHLVNIDTEFSSMNDDGVRHEQEERFWSTIIQTLVSHTRASVDDYESRRIGSSDSEDVVGHSSNRRSRTCCPLIVVLSSSKPLKPGPWLENLVFPSIHLSLPNVEYTKYLWKNNHNNHNNDHPIPWDDAMAKLLHGRGSSVIRTLRDSVVQEQSGGNHPTEASSTMVVLETMCRTYDDQRRRSHQTATVAHVRWDDVGGLAHVRDEIMDAIELPIKFPHLFSGGKGRTGILLYGTLHRLGRVFLSFVSLLIQFLLFCHACAFFCLQDLPGPGRHL
jgi:hypothetical protein